jgi:hypothetical protein
VFKRRAKQSAADAAPQAPPVDDAAVAAAEEEETAGPWDVDDLPADAEAIVRVDLGALRVPALPDLELRVETDPSGAVADVVLVAGPSSVQLAAFAAPRRAGIWDEVRAELLNSVRDQGGQGRERTGSFGVEVLATMPGARGRQTVRFVGIDGPRWLLRAVFTGPAATDPVQAATLEDAVRGVVVVRGGDALPVRDPLPLSLPADVLEVGSVDQEPGTERPSAPDLPKRGPEITETR